jgi:thioredoxin reductase (NADPH)
MAKDDPCEHLTRVARHRRMPVRPGSQGCEECLDMGDTWVHLRLCMTCGHVGCCDSSPNRHATKHHHASHHPVVKSFEPGESWAWCYIDERMMPDVAAFPDESPPAHLSAPVT